MCDFIGSEFFSFSSSGPYGSKSPRKGGDDQPIVGKTASMRFDELLPRLDRLVPPLKLKEGSISPRYGPLDALVSPRDRRPDDSSGRKKEEGVSPRERKLTDMPSPRERTEEGAAAVVPTPRDGKEKSVSPREDGPDYK